MNVKYLPEHEAQQTSTPQDVPIFVRPRAATSLRRTAEPVTFGVPLPRGAARDEQRFNLCDGDGRAVPTDTRVLERWADGSIRWMLVDALVSSDDTRETRYVLRSADRGPATQLSVATDGARTTVNTGRGEFVLRAGTSGLFERVVELPPD